MHLPIDELLRLSLEAQIRIELGRTGDVLTHERD